MESPAKSYGIVVINSFALLSERRPYRRAGDPWRFSCARHEGYGLTSKRQHIAQTVHGIARYACIPDDLRLGLASAPSLEASGQGPVAGAVGTPAVAGVEGACEDLCPLTSFCSAQS